MFVIKWKENGKTQEKTYDSKAGLQYRRRQIIKKHGEKAILSEVQTAGTGKNMVEIEVGGRSEAGPRGKIDPNLSQVDPDNKNIHVVESNWNNKVGAYTSRMYGKDFGRGYRVLEPDGSISLEGYIEEVVKKRSKDTGNVTLSDGRTFDGSGWPVKTRGNKK